MEILNCRERQISDLIADGELLAIKIGSKARRISEKSLEDFIKRRKITPDDLFEPNQRIK
jgi:excisionase family DNA binding protein